MARHETADETKDRYIEGMGRTAGELFHHLLQETAHLHTKWNEHKRLFSTKARVDALNGAAPGFFAMVQRSWRDDVILHLCRITDDVKKTLSIRSLAKALNPKPKGFDRHLQQLTVAIVPIVKLRHNVIAHRNLAIVLQKGQPLQPVTVKSIDEALYALVRLLSCVEGHFTEDDAMFFDHLEPKGGVEAVVHFVRRGVVAEEEDRKARRLPMRFRD
jgi:hypothetical protein